MLLVLSFGTYQLVAQEIRLTGDLDGSGAVDFVDFLLFASNFGKTGGAVFDAESVDTIVVRDTLVVRDTTIIVTDPVVETVYRETPKLLPSITIEPGGWQYPVGLVQAICDSVQAILSEPLIFALDSDIIVEDVGPDNPGAGPIVFYHRASNGSYRIGLQNVFSTGQLVFQFAMNTVT